MCYSIWAELRGVMGENFRDSWVEGGVGTGDSPQGSTTPSAEVLTWKGRRRLNQ